MPSIVPGEWEVLIPESVWFDLLAQDFDDLDFVTIRERLAQLREMLEGTGGLPPGAFSVTTVKPPCLGVVTDRLMALYHPVRKRPWWRWFWPWARDRCELHITWLTLLLHRTDSDFAGD